MELVDSDWQNKQTNVGFSALGVFFCSRLEALMDRLPLGLYATSDAAVARLFLALGLPIEGRWGVNEREGTVKQIRRSSESRKFHQTFTVDGDQNF